MIAIFAAALAGTATILFTPPSMVGRLQEAPPRARKFKHKHLAVVLSVNLMVFAIVPRAIYWTVMASAVYLCLSWVVAISRRSAAAKDASRQVLHGCNILSGQLKTGLIPAKAIQIAAEECPQLMPVAMAHQVGANVSSAMRRAADQPGSQGFGQLAGAWQLCQRTGAPVGPAVEQVVAGLRSAERTNRTVTTELASARATGRLLACLPVVGIGFGFAAGGNPINFLVGTTLGNVCLTLAVLLACAGVIWTERLALRVERRVG